MITIVITSNILTLYFTISNEMGGYANQKHMRTVGSKRNYKF